MNENLKNYLEYLNEKNEIITGESITKFKTEEVLEMVNNDLDYLISLNDNVYESHIKFLYGVRSGLLFIENDIIYYKIN